MVIFGAGASYDSCSSYQIGNEADTTRVTSTRLPLANELFQHRDIFSGVLNGLPDVRPFVARLANGGGQQSVEEALQELWGETKYERRSRQFMALRYYIRDIIRLSEARWLERWRSRLNHNTLINDIRRMGAARKEDVLLVTFNYDALIESAVFDGHLQTMDEYVERSEFKLIKLHGSVFWYRSATVPEQVTGPQGIIARADDVTVHDDYHIDYNLRSDEKRVPAIAIPISNKQEFSCPQGHQKALTDRLGEVTSILTIGWRGMEQQFLALLKKHIRRTVRVVAVDFNLPRDGNKNARQTVNRLFEAGVPIAEAGYYSNGFSSFVERSLHKAFEGLAGYEEPTFLEPR